MNNFPTRAMREHPNLEQLKRQAKELLSAFLAGDEHATAEVRTHYGDANPKTFASSLCPARVARAYGFQSWPKLKAYVDGVTATTLNAAVRSGDIERVRHMLRLRPELVNMNLSGFDDPLHTPSWSGKPTWFGFCWKKVPTRVRERTVGRLRWRKSAAMIDRCTSSGIRAESTGIVAGQSRRRASLHYCNGLKSAFGQNRQDSCIHRFQIVA